MLVRVELVPDEAAEEGDEPVPEHDALVRLRSELDANPAADALDAERHRIAEHDRQRSVWLEAELDVPGGARRLGVDREVPAGVDLDVRACEGLTRRDVLVAHPMPRFSSPIQEGGRSR